MHLPFLQKTPGNQLSDQFENSCQNAAKYISRRLTEKRPIDVQKVTALLGYKNGLSPQQSMLGATTMSRLREILDKQTIDGCNKSTLHLLENDKAAEQILPRLENSLSCRNEPINAYKKGELSFRDESVLEDSAKALLENARATSERILQSARQDSVRIRTDAEACAAKTLDDAQGSLRSLTDTAQNLEQKIQLANQRLALLSSGEAISSIQHKSIFQAQRVDFSAGGETFSLNRAEIDLYDDLIKLAGNGQLDAPDETGVVPIQTLNAPQMQSVVAFRRGEPIDNIQAGQTAALIIDNPKMLAHCTRNNIKDFRHTLAEAASKLMRDASSNDHKTLLSQAKSDLNDLVEKLLNSLDRIRDDEMSADDKTAIGHYIKSINRENYVNHFDKYTVPNEQDRMRGRHWNSNINMMLNILENIDRQVLRIQSEKV